MKTFDMTKEAERQRMAAIEEKLEYLIDMLEELLNVDYMTKRKEAA